MLKSKFIWWIIIIFIWKNAAGVKSKILMNPTQMYWCFVIAMCEQTSTQSRCRLTASSLIHHSVKFHLTASLRQVAARKICLIRQCQVEEPGKFLGQKMYILGKRILRNQIATLKVFDKKRPKNCLKLKTTDCYKNIVT